MPLDSFPPSAANVVPPPPSTARELPSGSPSSTAKMAALVASELARASVSLLEAEPQRPSAPEDPQELVELWAKKGHRRSATELAHVRLMKSEPPPSGDAAPRARFVFLALAAIAALATLAALAGSGFTSRGAQLGHGAVQAR